MTNLYEEARKLRLPGVRVTAAIYPQDISPRLKRMAQKMLYAGVITGGWSSTSKQLAEAVIEGADPSVPYVSLHRGHGVTIYNSTTLTDYAPFDELFEADFMLKVVDGYVSQSARERTEIYKQRLRAAGVRGEYISVGLSSNGLATTFSDLYVNTYSELTRARHAALAELLDGPLPISIII